jgi:hypothetical protein
MQTKISKAAGWFLFAGGFLLLAFSGKLDWLVILVPTSLVLGYGMAWMRRVDQRRSR